MITFHAVMTDECGGEFGADVEALSKAEAYDELRERYPESRVAQLESPDETAAREFHMYDHINRGGDWDDEGWPFFPHGDAADDWDDEDEQDLEYHNAQG